MRQLFVIRVFKKKAYVIRHLSKGQIAKTVTLIQDEYSIVVVQGLEAILGDRYHGRRASQFGKHITSAHQDRFWCI